MNIEVKLIVTGNEKDGAWIGAIGGFDGAKMTVGAVVFRLGLRMGTIDGLGVA